MKVVGNGCVVIGVQWWLWCWLEMVIKGGNSCLVEAGRLHLQKLLNEEKVIGRKRKKKQTDTLMGRDVNDSD